MITLIRYARLLAIVVGEGHEEDPNSAVTNKRETAVWGRGLSSLTGARMRTVASRMRTIVARMRADGWHCGRLNSYAT